MEKLKCIVVDDEPLAREGMKMNIAEVTFLELCGEFENAILANDFLAENKIDLMFLDIQMPGITGLQFIETLESKPMIILTTAFPQFALDGFNLDVLDYLVKPIRLERFLKAANKAKDKRERIKSHEIRFDKGDEEFVFIKSERRLVRLKLSEIGYISGMKDYVQIHTVNGEKYPVALNIKNVMEFLPAIFIRTSKSYVVNINNLKAVDTDSIKVCDTEISLGATFKEDFMKVIMENPIIDRNKS